MARATDKADATMNSVREQMDLREETCLPRFEPAPDDDELAEELKALDREGLDGISMGAGRPPLRNPAGATSKVTGELYCDGRCFIEGGR